MSQNAVGTLRCPQLPGKQHRYGVDELGLYENVSEIVSTVSCRDFISITDQNRTTTIRERSYKKLLHEQAISAL